MRISEAGIRKKEEIRTKKVEGIRNKYTEEDDRNKEE